MEQVAETPICPECGSDKVHFIGRPTREAAGPVKGAGEVFMCEVCGAQFTPLEESP
jgi:rubredoxin